MYATLALANLLRIWWKVSHHVSGWPYHIFPHLSRPELMVLCTTELWTMKCACIFIIQGLCTPTLYYPYVVVDSVFFLMLSCIPILNHLKDSCTSVFPYILQMQVLTIFTYGFPTDLNSYVTLVTVPFKHSLLSSLRDCSACHLCPDNEPIVT